MFFCCVFLDQSVIIKVAGVISMRLAPMSKSIGILNDEEDKNGEKDEVKLKPLVCVVSPLVLDVLPLYNEKSYHVILNLLSTLSLDST